MSRWYIIHAYSGFENKVKEQILADANRLGLQTLVEEIEVPIEKVTEVRRGKKVTSDRKFFPGYVLAKLAMNDDVYHLVKNTPKVTGFLGNNGKPQPITDAEASRILNTKEEQETAAPKVKVKVDFEIGDTVRVTSGNSRPSPASSRSSISTRAASRSRSRSSAAPPRWNWASRMSNG